jgi:TRAP transporter TAXI family solute receptor
VVDLCYIYYIKGEILMKKGVLLLTLLLSLTMIVAACGGEKAGGDGAAETTNLLMGTGSQGGTYFPLGAEMANVWNKNIENLNVTSTESGASVENIAKISSGEFDLGMAVNLPAVDAANGTGEFEGKKVENFAFIGHIYPEVMQVVTREATGVESIADLAGKKVAIGPPGSGTQAAAILILEAYGLKEGDYTAYQEGFGDAKAKLQDGTIDASFGLLGLPNSGIDELQASTKDVKFLEITGDALAYIEENSGYSGLTIKAGTYEWLEQDANTISAFAVLVASTDTVDDDLAYQLAKVLIENADQNTHPQSKHTTKENALNGSEGLPMHPGAKKYYQEIGLVD